MMRSFARSKRTASWRFNASRAESQSVAVSARLINNTSQGTTRFSKRRGKEMLARPAIAANKSETLLLANFLREAKTTPAHAFRFQEWEQIYPQFRKP